MTAPKKVYDSPERWLRRAARRTAAVSASGASRRTSRSVATVRRRRMLTPAATYVTTKKTPPAMANVRRTGPGSDGYSSVAAARTVSAIHAAMPTADHSVHPHLPERSSSGTAPGPVSRRR